ncbi:carbohydrate sulfotransferase 14-like [Diadema setosum]|uniref:carbohydrate sulfotransferase 14-like n=1 Tax=Diadema setosum TaxID=31175 RepID=UPI003B3A93DF
MMKVNPKRMLLVFLNGIVGYLVITLLVSAFKSNEDTQSVVIAEPKREIEEEPFRQTDDNVDQEVALFTGEWWKQMLARQEERKSRLRKVCHYLYNETVKDSSFLASHKNRLRPLIVNKKHRFIYSIVYKVGSTNWERVIVQDIEGFQNVPNQKLFSHKALQWMPKFEEKEVEYYLEQYTKFIFVRNPLSRILSGYRDKFVDHHNAVFSKLARQIIRQYRSNMADDSSGSNVTFSEFISYLIDSGEHRVNPHWKPIFAQNMPCTIDYDVIGKLEEASDDIPYVLKKTGLWNVTDYGKGPPRRNTDKELVRQYYSEVNPKLLKELYKVYEPDFLMFGYEMPFFL